MDSDQTTGLSERHRPVHLPPRASGNRSIVVFLTVCTAKRQPLLANAITHQLLRDSWMKAKLWLVGRYVIMPDHIHLFCAPGTNPPGPMQPWIAYWKRLVAFSSGGSFWQKNFWDTQLRQHESYEAKWEYVRQNPVRAGLVKHADEWPYQGELNLLRWHD
jgi:putative transposase